MKNFFKVFYVMILAGVLFGCGYLFSYSNINTKLHNNFAPAPSERTEFYQRTLAIHKRIDAQVPNNSKIIIGDSLTQGFLANEFVNFGIGSDTTQGVLNRIEEYESVKTASEIILLIGINDLGISEDDEILGRFEEIFNKIPDDKLIVLSLLPVTQEYEFRNKNITNDRIREVNKKLAILCQQKNIKFIDIHSLFVNKSGYLDESYQVGDGIHLNMNGYKVLSKAINTI